MVDCCEDKSCALEQLRERQAGTLKIVLMVNAVMFIVVLAAGLYASSTALLADSLDNLGDALTYALSLYVVWRSERAKATVSMFKGALIFAAALFVIVRSPISYFTPLCRCSRPWVLWASWPSLQTGLVLAFSGSTVTRM